MSDEVVYSFAIDNKMKRRLEEMAEEGHRTLAGQIRLILDQFIETDTKKARRKSD